MNKYERAIERIKDHMRVHGIGKYPHIHIAAALDLAIAALREQAERMNPKPLTVAELRQMKGETVWIVDVVMNEVECLRFDRAIPTGTARGDDFRFEQFGTDVGIVRWECKNGINWLAYRYPPKKQPKEQPAKEEV